MKAILLFTVLLCSNALASPVDKQPRLTSPPSTDRSALASTSRLTGPPSTKPVDEFLNICRSHRYLACRKHALLLKESTGEFARKNLLEEALQRAVKEGNGWAVLALSDSEVIKFRSDFYFDILDNYQQKSNQDLITLDVLRRKSIEMNSGWARDLARHYGYLDYITNPRPLTKLNFHTSGKRVSLDPSSVAAIKDAIKKSKHEQVYTLIQAILPLPYALREAGILFDACRYGDQFAVFYATKDFLMGLGKKEEDKSSIFRDAYKEAKKVGNKDAIEYFQQFHLAKKIEKTEWTPPPKYYTGTQIDGVVKTD